MAAITGAIIAAGTAVYSAKQSNKVANAQKKDIKKQAGEREAAVKKSTADEARERADKAEERKGASGYASTLGAGSRTLGGF
jgi:hypothetical protein